MRILFLLLVSICSYSQGIFLTGAAAQKSPKAQGLYYVDFPETPTFGTTTTINPTDASISVADLGGNSFLLLGAGQHSPSVNLVDFSNVSVKGADPDFANVLAADTTTTTSTVIGNNTTGTALWLRGSSFNNVHIYDLWANGGASTVNASLSSREFSLTKVRISGGSFAGINAKTDNDSTIAAYDITGNFIHISNTEGEGVYIGQVNGTNYHKFDTASFTHVFTDSTGREAFQSNHVKYLHLNKWTSTKIGWDTPSGDAQRKNIQIYDTFGLIENSVFVHNFNDTSSNTLYAIFMQAMGVTFRNCVFIGHSPIYIGNLEAQDWWPRSYTKQYYDSIGGAKILFDNCTFVITDGSAASGKLAQVFGDVMDIEFRDCEYSNNLTGLFNDGRSDKVTYDLIDGGGNSSIDASTVPFPEVDSLGRMITRYYWDRGIGWLTPN